MTTNDKRTALLEWNASLTGDSDDTIAYMEQLFSNTMTDQEINDVYEMIYNYYLKNIKVPEGSALQSRLITISNKYQIFT
jgi:hypothetical protein